MNRSMKHATTMLVAGLSLTVYVWFLYIFFTTMMRRVFIAKTKHAKAYSSVVLLKNTLKWKARSCLVFLNYMPTCLYVLGAWCRCIPQSLGETLKYDPYYKEADYTMPDMVPPDYGSNMKDGTGRTPTRGSSPSSSYKAPIATRRGRPSGREYLWLYGGRRRDALGARELRGYRHYPCYYLSFPPQRRAGVGAPLTRASCARTRHLWWAAAAAHLDRRPGPRHSGSDGF